MGIADIYTKKKKYYIDYAYWSNEIPKACSTKVTALAILATNIVIKVHPYIWRYRMIRPVNKKKKNETR
jgi:hypothetical protein